MIVNELKTYEKKGKIKGKKAYYFYDFPSKSVKIRRGRGYEKWTVEARYNQATFNFEKWTEKNMQLADKLICAFFETHQKHQYCVLDWS